MRSLSGHTSSLMLTKGTLVTPPRHLVAAGEAFESARAAVEGGGSLTRPVGASGLFASADETSCRVCVRDTRDRTCALVYLISPILTIPNV